MQALTERDPENRLLARGPRHRLQAEFIRDQALAVSGLLNPDIGGASVMPYQPEGLWEELADKRVKYSAQVYVPSKGRDLYRRSMYIFWKRTSPPPSLTTLDAPNRETCTSTESPVVAAAVSIICPLACFRRARRPRTARGCEGQGAGARLWR